MPSASLFLLMDLKVTEQESRWHWSWALHFFSCFLFTDVSIIHDTGSSGK